MLSRICVGSEFKVIQYVTKFDNMWDTGNCDVVNFDIWHKEFSWFDPSKNF